MNIISAVPCQHCVKMPWGTLSAVFGVRRADEGKRIDNDNFCVFSLFFFSPRSWCIFCFISMLTTVDRSEKKSAIKAEKKSQSKIGWWWWRYRVTLATDWGSFDQLSNGIAAVEQRIGAWPDDSVCYRFVASYRAINKVVYKSFLMRQESLDRTAR